MNLLAKNINLWDNGAISVGSFICFPCPMPIQQQMRCDIALLTSQLPAVLLKTQTMYTHPRHYEIESHTSLGFINSGANVNIQFSSVLKMSYSCLPCDRQRVSNWNGSRGCSCYGIFTNSSSLVVQHALESPYCNWWGFVHEQFFFIKIQQALFEIQHSRFLQALFPSPYSCINGPF